MGMGLAVVLERITIKNTRNKKTMNEAFGIFLVFISLNSLLIVEILFMEYKIMILIKF
jgi:hypothetical protein